MSALEGLGSALFYSTCFGFIVFLLIATMVSYQNNAFAETETKYIPFESLKGFDNMTQVCDYYNGTLHYYEYDVDREYCIVK